MLDPALIVCSNTDKRVANGIRRCISRITPQHSVTSRRHAISTLIREEIDVELDRVIWGYRRSWSWSLLEDFCLSKVWAKAPSGSPEPESGMNNLDLANQRARLWRARLRRSIHSAQKREEDHTRKDFRRFCDTLRFSDACSRCVQLPASCCDTWPYGAGCLRS